MTSRFLPALVVVAAFALTACSGGDDPYGYTPGGVAPAPPETLAPPPGTVLTANSTAQLGTVVLDGSGSTLYRFDADSADPPTATCADDCATAWPPVLAQPGDPLALEGVPQDAVGTVTRADGGVQVTIGGWPVYRHAADTAPGATDGHGLNDTWWAVTPEGGRAEAP